MKGMSRMETSKEVRRILNRNQIDLSLCQYTTYGNEVLITGILIKTNGSQLITSNIEAIIREIQQKLPGFQVRGNTENWVFSNENITASARSNSTEDNVNTDSDSNQRYVIDIDDSE